MFHSILAKFEPGKQMKQAEEFVILMQTVHLKTLLEGFLCLECRFLLSRSCQANLRVENQKTLVPGWPVNLVGGGGVGGEREERPGEEGSHSFFLCFPSLCLIHVGRRRSARR